MGAVAHWLACGHLAATEKHLFRFRRFEFHRQEFSILMRPVAERLICALAAGAPEVCFAFLDVYAVGRFLRNSWICHGCFLT